jgi:hypothetical protein
MALRKNGREKRKNKKLRNKNVAFHFKMKKHAGILQSTYYLITT